VVFNHEFLSFTNHYGFSPKVCPPYSPWPMFNSDKNISSDINMLQAEKISSGTTITCKFSTLYIPVALQMKNARFFLEIISFFGLKTSKIAKSTKILLNVGWVKGKVERPMDYIRQRFWRGYHYSSLARSNTDLENWLHETANCRLHGTHRQSVNERWQQEKLGELPQADYDTSIKVYRKVYKDCQLSYNGNRYVIPYHVVGKIVLLKIKHG